MAEEELKDFNEYLFVLNNNRRKLSTYCWGFCSSGWESERANIVGLFAESEGKDGELQPRLSNVTRMLMIYTEPVTDVTSGKEATQIALSILLFTVRTKQSLLEWHVLMVH